MINHGFHRRLVSAAKFQNALDVWFKFRSDACLTHKSRGELALTFFVQRGVGLLDLSHVDLQLARERRAEMETQRRVYEDLGTTSWESCPGIGWAAEQARDLTPGNA